VDNPAQQRAAAERLLAVALSTWWSPREQGVSWFSRDLALHASRPRCGSPARWARDSLVAGMVHGLLQAEATAQTLRRATAIAAQAVTQDRLRHPRREQLAQLEAAVQLTEQQEGCR
jgi:1-phosphofructokinase